MLDCAAGMADSLFATLSASHILAPLAKSLAAAWEPVATRRSFEPREVLFAPDDPATMLYVLCSGRVKLTAVSDQGKELIITLAGRGELLGELSPMAGVPHRTFAEAIEAGFAWGIPRDVVRDTASRDTAVALAFMQLHGARRQLLEQRLADFVFKEVPERLAAVLLEFAEGEGGSVQLTHYDLAGLIGSTRETTTLFLNKFREAGWVRLDKRRVTVVDAEAVAAVAAGERDAAATPD